MRTDNVYGENHPPEEDASPGEHGIREQIADADRNKDTAQDLDETRQQMIDNTDLSGGAGRVETPRDGHEPRRLPASGGRRGRGS
jgi:hypothetical protein